MSLGENFANCVVAETVVQHPVYYWTLRCLTMSVKSPPLRNSQNSLSNLNTECPRVQSQHYHILLGGISSSNVQEYVKTQLYQQYPNQDLLCMSTSASLTCTEEVQVHQESNCNQGEREWHLGVREREWIIPFPKFGNGKGAIYQTLPLGSKSSMFDQIW